MIMYIFDLHTVSLQRWDNNLNRIKNDFARRNTRMCEWMKYVACEKKKELHF